MALIFLGVQILSGGLYLGMAQILADGKQGNTGIQLMGCRGVPQPVCRGMLQIGGDNRQAFQPCILG